MQKKKKISAPERDQIAVMLASGLKLRKIAEGLGRSVSSISDEIKRNSVKGVYKSIAANNLSLQRNRQSRKTNPLKSPKIFSLVFDKLREGWSPEQIAGRLKRLNHGETVICHETIYQYIYSPEGKKRGLHEYLVRHHQKRRPWYGRCLYRRGIANRVSIRLRPEEINTKKTFGHWEADTVEGKAHQKGIQTLLERKTRFYQAKILANIDSEYGVKAQNDILVSFPKKARKSVTFDNGKENYNHLKLQRWLNIQTYFCDPNCAWQKGSNEYHNAIVEEINNQPKKCLDYQTAREAFRKELKYSKCSDST